jgi:hypothetical protein
MGFNSANANETWRFKRRNVAISEQQMAETVIRRRGPSNCHRHAFRNARKL